MDDPECDLHSYGDGDFYDQQLYGDSLRWRRYARGFSDAIKPDGEPWRFGNFYGDDEPRLHALGF